LDTKTPRSAARAPQSMLRSVSSLTPVGPPALAMISRMSNARSTDCTAPAVAFCASIMGSAPIGQSKGTAPQCDSASIRHRDETSGYGGLPLLAYRIGAEPGAGLAQRRGAGYLPVLVPGPQKPQTVDEFAHHFFVGVVEEQRHRQHEIHDHPGRE